MMAEFPELGEQCFHCQTLDFLPVVCDFCKETFCKHHLPTIVHDCKSYTEADNILTLECPEKNVYERCNFCRQQVKNRHEMVNCDKCNQLHCLHHRLAESHDCSVLKKENPPKTPFEVVLPVTRPSAKVTGIKGAKNDALAKKVRLMKLKQSAVGLSSIPQSERIYFTLHISSNTSSHGIFLSSQWSIGKCVDFVADKFGVKNNNNKNNMPKLMLSNEDEQLLPFEAKINELITQNLVENGQKLTLKYVDSS